MYNVYQHWDPLKICVVGRSYPPEFYSWISSPHVRTLFEKIAVETEEDYQAIIKKLEEFSVKVLRPELPEIEPVLKEKYQPPPMTPRDFMVMIGDQFFENFSFDLVNAYNRVRDPSWPIIKHQSQFLNLPKEIQQECFTVHNFLKYKKGKDLYNKIFNDVCEQGNDTESHVLSEYINGAMISRIGKDLYFGTHSYGQDVSVVQQLLQAQFPNHRVHVVNTGGHSDATFCPVTPGLIISLNDVPTYKNTFPGWEVVYLPNQSWSAVKPFLDLKQKNNGKWWIPGFEYDQSVIDTVETWLSHWTGYVEETVFDVNMLIIDTKNVMVFNYNKQVFDALDRFGITPHIVPFRHRYFWDGGIHCVTADLHREGNMQDFFPERR
jgi:glycine amidinotransferase